MPQFGKVDVGWEVLIGWNELQEAERRQILDRLTRLAELPPSQWETDDVTLRPGTSHYVLHGPGDFRIVFRPTAEGLRLIDIYLQQFVGRNLAGKA